MVPVVFLVVSDDKSDEIEPVADDFVKKYHYYNRIRMRNRWQLYAMLTLNPTLRKYRTKPKKQGFIQKALLQIGKLDLESRNLSADDGEIEHLTDKNITGNKIELLEIQHTDEDKENIDDVLCDTSKEDTTNEKLFLECNKNINNKIVRGDIAVTNKNEKNDAPLEKRKPNSPVNIKDDLEILPLLYKNENHDYESNLHTTDLMEYRDLDTDNNSHISVERKREPLLETQISSNSLETVKSTLTELLDTVESSSANYGNPPL